MGGCIAMTYANAGIPVLLKEVDEAALTRGLATIRKNYEVTVAKGKMSPEALDKTMALITPTTSYDKFGDVDIVVEAVFENMDLKKTTFAELGKVTRPDCILASNTSTLDIDEFAQASGRPRQVIGQKSMSHENRHDLVVKSLGTNHPVMKGFPAEWPDAQDELYKIEYTWPGVVPLAKAYGVETQKEHVVIWLNTYGKGRSFVTTLGHFDATMKTDVYLDLVARGLLWAVGKLQDDGAPAPGYGPRTK